MSGFNFTDSTPQGLTRRFRMKICHFLGQGWAIHLPLYWPLLFNHLIITCRNTIVYCPSLSLLAKMTQSDGNVKRVLSRCNGVHTWRSQRGSGIPARKQFASGKVIQVAGVKPVRESHINALMDPSSWSTLPIIKGFLAIVLLTNRRLTTPTTRYSFASQNGQL